MARDLPRTSFNSSRLVRVLSDLAVAETADSKQPFAERLGQWLGFTDGLALFSALNAGGGDTAARPAAAGSAARAARAEFDRVRTTLTDSIAADGLSGKARIELPPAEPAEGGGVPDFAPYHRYYLAHQRDMIAAVGPLRASLRAALSRQSPALKRLAGLDAVMDQAFTARERSLLATVPQLLAKRFEQAFDAHRSALADSGADDDPAGWMQPGGWLAGFCGEMKTVLLAELELRLQPIAGLIEALAKEVDKQQ